MLQKIIAKTGLSEKVVGSIIELLEEGNTVPFIARYRKELTEGATDTQLRDFEEIYNYQKNLEERRADILRLMAEKEVLTPELEKALQEAQTLAALEDIYRPFKEKKNTRATKAIAKWLQPLADILLEASMTKEAFEEKAQEFVIDTGDAKTSVADVKEAIQGAMDICAEVVSDNANVRTFIKETEEKKSVLQTKATKKFDEQWVYGIYREYAKKMADMPSYAYLAVCRAEKEKQLSVKLTFGEEKIEEYVLWVFVPATAASSVVFLQEAIFDGLKRLVYPSIERELRSNKKELSDREAIDVFGKNVQAMLMLPPVKGKVILGFDPAYRTWCKLAVIDATGKFLHNDVIYPTKPQQKIAESAATLTAMVKKYSIDLICIGNGTGSRESEQFVAETIKKNDLTCKYMIVSEAGASVYSASKLAEKEYPDLDVTVRGAINIAQRIQDPLATYVKIDPKSLGVGQYQHDVDQKLLKEKLDNKIEDTVNSVWVDVNTASAALLQHIAGLSAKTAQNVVSYRDENGVYASRAQVKKAKGVGPKAFEQAAGFLRINHAKEQLDSTGIHPETYKITYEILEKECGIKKKQLTLPYVCPELNVSSLASRYDIGEETLHDIIAELANPGLDPRQDFDEGSFKSDVLTIDDLSEWMSLTGVVRNIVDFGAFVDVGLKNDGLVHKSQMANYYVTDPFEVVQVGDTVTVKVIGIDKERKRVQLSMKTGETKTTPKKHSAPKRERRKPQETSNVATSTIKGNISRS